MKKFYSYLIALFMVNDAMAQGLIPEFSINALAKSKHPTSRLNENFQDGLHNKEIKMLDLDSKMNLGKIIKPQTQKPKDFIQIYDSIYSWVWDSISMGWTIDSKTINFIYDANHNELSELYQTWDGNAWVNSMKYTYAYDASNNETSQLVRSWNGSAWENYKQYSYTYDASNNLINSIWQNWNGSAWVNYRHNAYAYDANNNLISELNQYWNSSAWENAEQYSYIYDANNNMTSRLYQTWNGVIWEDSYKNTYTYDANYNLKSDLSQTWNGSIWVNSGQYTYIYDANNNITSELDQSWDGSAWVNYMKYTHTYDANNFTKSFSFKYWNSTGTQITSGDSSYYYFHKVLGINDLVVSDANITIYPNPGYGKFTISSNSSISTIEIYNLLGERIYSDYNLSRQASIELSSPCSGVYIAIINAGTRSYSRKIIVN